MSTDTTSQDVLRGGGEMGALMRSIDWSRTVVGPVSAWPQSLRTALSILLETGFPMYIAWGPEYTQFYNDGYRPILGSTKHPGAMGASTRETFAEIWDIIGPMFAGVMQGTPTTLVDFMLPLDRHGFTEECYFIFSYSPIRQESGTVGGVLVTVTETTQRVLGERRLKTTQELAARTRGATRVSEACRLSGEVIGQNPADVPFALIYLVEEDGTTARLVSTAGIVANVEAIAPARLSLEQQAGDLWPIGRAVHSREAILVDVPSPGPASVPGATRVLVLPIAQQDESGVIGALVAGLSPRLMLDGAYTDFLAMVASQIGTAVVSARAFEEAEARAQALADLDRAKTAFFSNVSHEFRTPLTLLLGPTEEAAASPDGVLQGADLQTVHRNAQRLLKLVNALLDFSRIEAGRVQAVFEPTDLATVTADLASAFRSATERAGLDLIVDCPPLPERVYLDRDMWEKVVLNLLSNAFKFTFAGSITVSLAWHGSTVALTVRDTGGGIAAEDLPHVFDRFHRVESARARTQEGSGIGLALVRELVAMHGGSIDVTSLRGRGTTFTVSLPTGSRHLPADRIGVARTPAPLATGATAYVQEALRWLPSPATVAPPPPSKSTADRAMTRVLVADDNADMRDYITRLLGDRWTVEAVRDGAAALASAQAHRPDVVVADVMMPEIDGFELLQRLRADERTQSVPVILVSARAGEEARVEGLQAGADDYLVKPFAARELIARVQAQVMRSKMRSVEEAHALRLANKVTELAKARREAEAANRTKDEFLAMLGHELRNPLAPILTALQLMNLRGVVGADRERHIIERQVKHVVGLVDDLLDVSRITRGNVQLRQERLQLADVVAKAIEIASPAIEERRQTLQVDVATGLDIDGDAARLAQVFANLLNNAAKYTEPQGTIRVSAKREPTGIVIRVSDNGNGIAPETLPRIFDLFVQEQQAPERAQGGLGIGLAIVRSLVQAHGGTVRAESPGKGRGSTFTVTLPAADARQPVAAAPEVPSRVAAAGHRLLLVDDNEDAAMLLADSLRALGHLVEVAHDGPSALTVVEEFKPVVALLDLGLPVMDGFELGERLRADPDLQGIVLIAVTGYAQELDRRRSAASGFDAHMAKPIDVHELDRLIRVQANGSPSTAAERHTGE